jgi:hypothetical protein
MLGSWNLELRNTASLALTLNPKATESTGPRNCVGIKRDIYFNENEVLEPEEVIIEGGNELLTNLHHPQPPSKLLNNPLPYQPVQNASDKPENEPDDHEPTKVPMNAPVIQPNDPESSTVVPHQRNTRHSSLEGLP